MSRVLQSQRQKDKLLSDVLQLSRDLTHKCPHVSSQSTSLTWPRVQGPLTCPASVPCLLTHIRVMSRVVHHLVNSHSRPGRTAVAGTDPSSSIYVTITDRLVTFAFSQVNKLIRYHRNISYLSYLHNKEQTQELLEYPAENQDG